MYRERAERLADVRSQPNDFAAVVRFTVCLLFGLLLP